MIFIGFQINRCLCVYLFSDTICQNAVFISYLINKLCLCFWGNSEESIYVDGRAPEATTGVSTMLWKFLLLLPKISFYSLWYQLKMTKTIRFPSSKTFLWMYFLSTCGLDIPLLFLQHSIIELFFSRGHLQTLINLLLKWLFFFKAVSHNRVCPRLV